MEDFSLLDLDIDFQPEFASEVVRMTLQAVMDAAIQGISSDQVEHLLDLVGRIRDSENLHKALEQDEVASCLLGAEGFQSTMEMVHFILHNMKASEADPSYLTWNLLQLLELHRAIEEGGLPRINFFMERPELSIFMILLTLESIESKAILPELECPEKLVQYGLRTMLVKRIPGCTAEQGEEIISAIQGWVERVALPANFCSALSRKESLASLSLKDESSKRTFSAVHLVLRSVRKESSYLIWNLCEILKNLKAIDEEGYYDVGFLLKNPEIVSFAAWLSSIPEDLLLDFEEITADELEQAERASGISPLP